VVQARSDSLQDGQVENRLHSNPSRHTGSNSLRGHRTYPAGRSSAPQRWHAPAWGDLTPRRSTSSTPGAYQESPADRRPAVVSISRQQTRSTSTSAGRSGRIRIHPRNIIAGPPLTFHFTAAIDTAIDQRVHAPQKTHMARMSLCRRVAIESLPGKSCGVSVSAAHGGPPRNCVCRWPRFGARCARSPAPSDRADEKCEAGSSRPGMYRRPPAGRDVARPASASPRAGDHAITRVKNETTR